MASKKRTSAGPDERKPIMEFDRQASWPVISFHTVRGSYSAEAGRIVTHLLVEYAGLPDFESQSTDGMPNVINQRVVATLVMGSGEAESLARALSEMSKQLKKAK